MDGKQSLSEEPSAERKSGGYKSWKKKYRKMRIAFDKQMHEGEELHRQEAKATNTVKRLAVENDRLLDLLLDINNSPQIPFDKRFELSFPRSSNPLRPPLAIDEDFEHRKATGDSAMKRFEQLSKTVPHVLYDEAPDSFTQDLTAPEGEAYPVPFLTPDDIDNYIHSIDTRIDPDAHIPTLAPNARPSGGIPQINPHLKNPTSVTNWLRKHAPKVFLQDTEHPAADAAADDADGVSHGGASSGRKSRGGARGDRGGRTTGRAKKAGARFSIASAAAATDRADGDASMDDDPDFAASTPATTTKGKRKRDDDPGYRPRGSSSRPTKKKRKSEGGEGTPVTTTATRKVSSSSKKDRDRDRDRDKESGAVSKDE